MADDDGEEEAETKKPPPKEIPVIQDEGFFQHSTGDTYDGFFEVKKKDRSLKMNGPGIYTTAEGDIYTGVWEGDKLSTSEEASISYTDGSRYEGYIKDWSYSGKGKYIYPDTSELTCDFVENCPVGKLVLTDPNKHTWLAVSEHGFGWFEPVNHFYEMLPTICDASSRKRNRKKHHEKDPESSGKHSGTQASAKSKK